MSRNRLLASMDSLAKKRQKEFDEVAKWSNQKQYYKNWDTHNNKYQNWTSTEYYKHSTDLYDTQKSLEKKQISLDRRREQLRKLYFDEEQEYELEMRCSPRYGRNTQHSKMNQTPTEVLKDVNIGIKLAEDDRRRHEAELQLYHQWKNDNPIIRNFESNQNKSELKLAWLDQQIEKRMAQERNEAEMKKLIEERDKRLLDAEQFDKEQFEEKSKQEKLLMNEIELQIKQFRLKEDQASDLKHQESEVMKKKVQIEDLIQKNAEELQQRKNREIALYNINQSKLKLRKKATLIEEQLKKDQKLLEDLLASQTAEEIQNEAKRQQTKNSIDSSLIYIREQQQLEQQRQKYISFIFDSEAKHMLEKQERQWAEEQHFRNKLLEDVLKGIQEQIEEKLQKNLEHQRQVLQEREEMLQSIEDHDRKMKISMEEMTQKTMERKLELDKQVNEKRVLEARKKLEEDMRKKDELDKIRREEEKLKNELMRMQNRQYPQNRFNNRRILW